MRADPLIFVSAGEASGDHYGAQLITGLRQALPEATFVGLGGSAMLAAGQRRIVRAEDVAFMGITEILRHVPRVLNSYRRLVRTIRSERPSVAVLIDFPDVNFRLAKHCKRLGIPVIWFVSPQLWAWKRKRLRWVQQRVSQMLTIFPFEQPFYQARGVSATFVGHPLAEAPLPSIPREEYAQLAAALEQRQYLLSELPRRTHPRPYWTIETDPALLHYPLDPQKPWVALLPGSRAGEIAANLPGLVQAAKLLGNEYEYLIPIAPGLTAQQLYGMQRTVAVYLKATPEPRVTLVHDARAALLHSRAAVVASGTATVQAAVLGTPFVTVYRVSNATFRAAKRLVAYPPEVLATPDSFGNLPVAMPNLIAGRRVTRELLQNQFTAENVVAALRPLLQDGPERDEAIAGLREVRQALLAPGEQTSMDRLRDAVLQELASVS
ncbi:lipid-A-disaccharide synthase [Terriglobus sp.]|uniref:lipid-A-disaccharide synthase n=1 Tax=Terriglobus sp. TaxID=1889013 RepID=UPI003B00CA15